MSISLWPHGLQHARLPCPSLTPEAYLNFVHRVGDAIQPSHPLTSPFPHPSIFPSIRGFSNESVLHIRWPKYWSFSFIFSLSNEYSGLISFRTDWFDFLAVQDEPKFRKLGDGEKSDWSLVIQLRESLFWLFRQINDWTHHLWDKEWESGGTLPGLVLGKQAWLPKSFNEVIWRRAVLCSKQFSRIKGWDSFLNCVFQE